MWVPSLVRELRSCMLHGSQKLLERKKERKSIGKVLGTEQLLNKLWLLLFNTELGQEK